MLGISNTLSSSSTPSSSAAVPGTLASYTSDFTTAGLDGWTSTYSGTAPTLTSNVDSIGGEDDVLSVLFNEDTSSTLTLSVADVLADGGIVLGDTASVSFKYRFSDADPAQSNISFSVRLGDYSATRAKQEASSLDDTWIDFSFDFDEPAANSNREFKIVFNASSSYPDNGDTMYFKDFSVVHTGLPR